jgi:hypothetical protein
LNAVTGEVAFVIAACAAETTDESLLAGVLVPPLAPLALLLELLELLLEPHAARASTIATTPSPGAKRFPRRATLSPL